MAKEAEAERERRAKIVAAEGEYQASMKLGQAADIITQHPVALQLRTLQTMAEIATEKNSTIIFPAQFMTTVQEAIAMLNKDSLLNTFCNSFGSYMTIKAHLAELERQHKCIEHEIAEAFGATAQLMI